LWGRAGDLGGLVTLIAELVQVSFAVALLQFSTVSENKAVSPALESRLSRL
jgi:hypothetical protein